MQQCIDSISGQTYPNIELIIMDGASSDGTVAILENNDKKISYWESEKDRGIAHAWNKALEHVSGEWVIFLGADDRLQDAQVLSDMAEFLRSNSQDDIVYGKIIYEGGVSDGLSFGSQDDLSVISRRMAVPHTATFNRSSLFKEVGDFDENFKIAIDYEFFLRKELFGCFVDRLVCVMGGEGVSSRLVKKSLSEFRKAQIKHTVGWRLKIEALHIFYQFRHQIKVWRTKGSH